MPIHYSTDESALESAKLKANGTSLIPNCPKKKKCFSSKQEAVAWEETNRQKYPNIAKQHAYLCEDCPSWHLSAMPPESFGLARSSVRPIEPETIKLSGRRRCTLEEIEHRYRVIGAAMDENPGLSRAQLAAKICGPLGISEVNAYQFLRSHEEQLSARGLPIDAQYGRRHRRISTSLETISQKRSTLEAQLAALNREEQRLIEAKALKLTPCWEGNGVLIQKEGSSLGLTLDDAKELAEKLMEYLTHPAAPEVNPTNSTNSVS